MPSGPRWTCQSRGRCSLRSSRLSPAVLSRFPLSVISEALNVPTITVPIANYDNNQHAEDESIRLQNLWDGIEMMTALMLMR